MEHLAIKFKCENHRGTQKMLLADIRTKLMLYTAYIKKCEYEFARQYLRAAVTTMDVLVALNKNYRIDVTKTFTIHHAEDTEEKSIVHKTAAHKQFWKKGA